MLLERGWKMFLHEMPYVMLRFNGGHYFDDKHFRFNVLGATSVIYNQSYNEYVFSPHPSIQSAVKAPIYGNHTPLV